MQDFKSLAGERFSARKFTAEPVSKEDLEYIMECVRLAPSACNRQPWKWLIVRSEQAMKKLQECYDREWFKTAPMYIVGMKNTEDNWVRKYDNKPHGDILMWRLLPSIFAWLPQNADWVPAGYVPMTATR